MGKVHRRICFLRSEGRHAEAGDIEARELSSAVDEARRACESDAESDSLLAAVRADGEERVADAVAFAEVLVPLLTERLSLAAPGAAEPPRRRRPAPEEPGEPREIADFIDEMLAHERAGSR